MPQTLPKTIENDGADKPDATVTPLPAYAPQPNLNHTKVKGRFNQYTSGYWALTVPLLSARYIAEGIDEVFTPVYKAKASSPDWKPRFGWAPKEADRIWAKTVGTGMVGVTAFYTARTYGDMKRQFAEPLGWEFDKSPDKVGLPEMISSKNTLVRDAVRNLARRTFWRFLADVPFFTYLMPSPFRHSENIPENIRKEYKNFTGAPGGVHLGVGVNAVYLASDALNRKRSFFEEIQIFIDNKINHTDRIGDRVTAEDLVNLYDRQARNNPAVRPLPKMSTPEWENDMKLFERMADLMNQTYGNTPVKEYADFTVPKLIYMLGMRLLKSDNSEKNMAYLEVANRYGIRAVQQVAHIAGGHGDLKVALAPFPIDEQLQTEKSFAQQVLRQRGVEQAASQAERVTQSRRTSNYLALVP